MDSKNKTKGSFFKRAADENPQGARPSVLDNSEYSEPKAAEERPRFDRSARPAYRAEDRRPSSSGARGGYNKGGRDDRRSAGGEGAPGADRFSSDDRGGREDRFSNDDRGSRGQYGDRERGARPSRDDKGPRTPGADFRKNVPYEQKDAPENVIYGVHPVREAIEIGTAIEKIYLRRAGDERENGARGYSDNAFGRQTPTNNASLDMIRSMAEERNIPVQEVPVEKLDRLTRRNPHQGVVAVVPAIEYADINELIEKLSQRDVPALIVVVDGVTDVRNFGAIARSAECAGADAVIMGAKNSAPVNAEAMKSSAGALSIIPVCRVGSIRNTLKMLQMAGMQLVAATEKSGDFIFEADFTKPTVIIMGGEERGISGDVLAMCDKRIAIPLLGKIESLNVSAAAAVLLFEAVRQRFNATEE